MTDGGPRIGIVTGTRAPELTDDGRAVASELRDRGYEAEPVIWSESGVDWSRFDGLVVRSCWQYYEDPDAFRAWLGTVERNGVVVVNPPDVIRWNVHKFYLRDLETAGVSVVPTAYVDRGADVDLGTVLARNDWTDAVIKPAIGTSSSGVWRASTPIGPDAADRFEAQRAERDLLVQQFAPEVLDGELSLIFFGGAYSHANRSVPADDDFRAHPDFGVSTAAIDPAADLVAQARTVLEAAANVHSIDPSELTYARVDGVERGGSFELIELELIEPYLGLSRTDGALDRFVDAIDAALCRRSDSIARALS
ncbi:RimK family alpha-L-glutamate ligase [Halosolutus amylolyticus]|uniref:RimK family alpha-L-glutamate ligase n=1 Tax=Halosolutus amylolyticus TaxID=2932267 RepID=A0ABD5PL80_9EURY|nr:hypothetical protein [Halosolutus amylolyticus]